MLLDTASTPAALLTPRQDRLEGAIAYALRTYSTRSELREAVHRLVDLFRLQGVSPESGVMRIRELAMRGTLAMTDSSSAAGDAPAERVASVVEWARRRYERHD